MNGQQTLTMELNSGSKKKIAILGAGPSGLVAAKEVLENGMIPTVFEKETDLGGVWNLNTGCVWNTMHTNISKFTTTYGDTDWPLDTEMFPSVQSMFKYLNDYAVKWNIRDNIKFNTNVVQVFPNNNEHNNTIGLDGWTVKWTNKDDLSISPTLQSDLFDGVIVATGIFAKTNIPEFRGLNSFTGKLIHSKEYKDGKSFKDLKVLTVGGSFSGAEIAADVSNYCSVSYHCFREPFWILRKNLPDKKRGKNIPLDLLFYTRTFYSQPAAVSAEESFKSRNGYMASICQEQQHISELAVPSDAFERPYNSVVSDQYLIEVSQGKLIPKHQGISEINGSSVIFQNGDNIQVDALILATGFQSDIKFLDENVLKKIRYDQSDRLQPIVLFNECCHPDLENLFFVGMYKGPYFAVMEQQARLAARVLSRNISLPSSDLMVEGMKKEKEIRDALPRLQFPHPEYVLFADEISRCARSFPDLRKFEAIECTLSDAFENPLKDDALYLEQHKSNIYKRFMTEPVIPSNYNLANDPVESLHQMDLVQEALNNL